MRAVSMNRIVQRFAVQPTRPTAGFSLAAPPDAPLFLERAALIEFLQADAACAATTSATANGLAI